MLMPEQPHPRLWKAWICTVSLVASVGWFSTAISAFATGAQNAIFEPLQEKLSRATRVPLYLPERLPFHGSEKVYAILEHADRDSYTVDIAFAPDCNGANVCSIGHVTGSRLPINNLGKRVVLNNGDVGTFRESQCTAYCDESVLTWHHHGYTYAIAIKAARLAEALTIANSMGAVPSSR